MYGRNLRVAEALRRAGSKVTECHVEPRYAASAARNGRRGAVGLAARMALATIFRWGERAFAGESGRAATGKPATTACTRRRCATVSSSRRRPPCARHGPRARHGVPLSVSGSLALPLAALDMVVIATAW